MNMKKLIIRYLILMSFVLITVFNGDWISTLPWYVSIIIFVYCAMIPINRIFPSFNTDLAFSKHFAINYVAKQNTKQVIPPAGKDKFFLAIGMWIIGLAIVGTLYFAQVIVAADLFFLVILFYFFEAICTEIWCPFKKLIFKNRCCTDCRIGNWDCFFLFSPLIFLPNIFTIPLIALSIVCIVQWEYAHIKHKERFYQNKNISCINCQRKCTKRGKYKELK